MTQLLWNASCIFRASSMSILTVNYLNTSLHGVEFFLKVMTFPPLYGTWWFSRIFTKSLPLVSLMSLMNPVHSLLTISLMLILILSYHLYLCFPTKTMYVFLIFPTCFACSTPLILLKIAILNEQHNLWSSSFCSFFHPLGTSAVTNNKNNTIFNL
jgi:hypothetical protein